MDTLRPIPRVMSAKLTVADWTGACIATLAPLAEQIRAHVLGAEHIMGTTPLCRFLPKDLDLRAR